jgi:tetratricopeptide (TPR) repeat protein
MNIRPFFFIIFIALASCQQEKKSELLYQEGLQHYKNSEFLDAIEIFSQAIDKNKFHAKAFLSRGQVHLAMANGEAAYHDFQMALAINPLLPDAHIGIAKVHLRRLTPNNRAAMEHLTKAIDSQPNYSPAWFERGILRSESGDLQNALTDFSKAITLRKEHPEAYYQRARLYIKLGKDSSALVDLNQAISLFPNYAEALNQRGLIHMHNTNYRDAIADFEKAIGHFPSPGKEYYNLGLAYSKTGQWREALSAFNKSVELAPGIGLTHFERGNTWEKLGNTYNACMDWKKAMDIGNANAAYKFNTQCK